MQFPVIKDFPTGDSMYAMVFDNDPTKIGQEVGEFIVQDIA